MISFLHPNYLVYTIPAALLLLIILKLDFLRSKEDDFRRKDRRKTKIFIFFTRAAMIVLLFLALSEPFVEIDIVERGPPRVLLLVDESTSMDLFNVDSETFKTELEKKIPLKTATIGRNTTSNLGDGILSNLEADANVLLITDGYSNSGITLGDVAARATSINATISALSLSPEKEDASIYLLGDERTFTDVDYVFQAKILTTTPASVQAKIIVDDKVIFDQKTSEKTLTFTQKFQSGTHTITAELTENDHFSQNNRYYKTVKVIEKPKVLFVTQKTDPFEQILKELYTTTTAATIPADLSTYSTIIVNDLPASAISKDTMLLTNFLTDGGGLLFIGGFNSFDRGSYKNNLIETILPVKIGTAEKRRGNSNIVLVIDISGASDIMYEGKKISPLDVNKALALEVIKTLNMANRVGVIAFNDKPYLVSDLAPLFENKKTIEDKISRLTGGGQSSFDVGLKGAYELLKTTKGDRVIILLTDGLAYTDVQERTKSVANSLQAFGITTYVVGVGRNVQGQFLSDLADIGGGIYFSATDSNKLSILFGEPEDIKQGEDFGLFILNPSHFITKDLSVNVVLNGYNEVVPKSAARSLITTSSGSPAFTVWNYGIGRVGAINVFTGGNLGSLLTENNSIVLARTVNWLIGDPERKQEYLVMINDGTIDKQFTVRVRSEKRPDAEGFEFYKAGENLYEAEKFNVNTTGFHELIGQKFAVNTEREYTFTGFNDNLATIIASTGGKLFKPQDTDQIADFMKKQARKTHLQKVFFTWPFIILAILIFLTEITIRKTQEHLKEKKED